MKKYLMTLAAFALVSSAFVSCSNDEGVAYDPTAKKVNDYNAAFIARYGQPAANQDWGFGTTRAINVNGNLWEETPECTAEEAKLVFDYVNMTRAQMTAAGHKFTEVFPENIKNYFVTQVYTGTDTYSTLDGSNSGILGSSHMDHLNIAMDNTGVITDGELVGKWEHINNFNASSNMNYGGNTLVTDGGTLDFAYICSEDSRYHNKWIAINGADVDPSLAGKYYICFDFMAENPDAYTNFRFKMDGTEYTAKVSGAWTVESATAAGLTITVSKTEWVWDEPYTVGHNETTEIEVTVGGAGTSDWRIDNVVGGNKVIPANDVYTDWIVRIVAAKPASEYVDRVICEDLGTTDDSDFNDVAFDIRYADGGAYFRVVSVGGIYPLYVAGNEVHEMFGAQPKADGTYQILGERTSDEFFVRGATKAADIEVKVTYIDKSGTATAAPASTFTLKADQGKVPQKICVSPKFQLCAERQNIGSKYPAFKDYVADPTVAWY